MSTEPSSQAAATTMAGSPGSAESIAASTSDNTNAPGRATLFSSHSATPSTTASRDPRKDPIPAPGASGSTSFNLSTDARNSQHSTLASQQQQPSQSSQSSSSSAHSAQSGGSAGKSMFDETPEQAAAKKEYLKKLSSGNKEAVKEFEKAHANDGTPPQLDTSKPVSQSAQMDLEQWGDKDPVYNSKAAAKDDYYAPAKNPNEEVQEDVTVAATKLLLADPAEVAKLAKEKGK